MINEERVKHMTQMAIFEKEFGPDYEPMLKYSRKDYVALHGWGGFLGGTIFFWLLYAGIVVYLMGNIIENITTMYILLISLIGLLAYAAYIILHVHFVRRRAAKTYKIGRRMIKELGHGYAALKEMYDNEAQQTRPLIARYDDIKDTDTDEED